MLFAQYGQWRALGVPRFAALAGVYLLGSLPLLNAHAALGGYADLWLAALLSPPAGHAWLRWRRDRDSRQLLDRGRPPAVASDDQARRRGVEHRARRRLPCSARCPKACAPSASPSGSRWRRRPSSRPGLRRGLDRRRATLCRKRARLALGSIGQSIAALSNALWGQWNWNLLWFALPVALVWNAPQWRRDPTARRLLVLLAIPLALIFGLFVFTTASRYAQSYSAVNRLLLQMTPLLVASLLFALWPASGRSDQAGVARTASV